METQIQPETLNVNENVENNMQHLGLHSVNSYMTAIF